ncbi:xylose ABC transporter ATP-binding protein [Echinimonas agarilytica]|uniref:Xylose ABC transporter ATP-binding protein n=1 Tax=Echinimonas agarilytica TaxID=1215918 RepID=A0AA42B761_9GAMM|nr:xylose ABC transporter ATP-binding protein [Echinimonas agarilytica]MCM2678878.1 xylose ABC transporter ATP-binding protein [Echinimonas agarilytica]
MSQAMLEMRDIIKEFSGVRALNGVDLCLNPGEVVSLCGENGSGKSTLMKVLSGIYPKGEYQGEIKLDGQTYEVSGIKDAERKGIAIIHQELALIKELTILENLFLGDEISQFGVLNHTQMYKKAQTMLERVGLTMSPDTPILELGVGQQQLVEIAKALGKNARILILDEPTSSLTESETEVLLNIVMQLKSEGVSCVYISHKLNEVLAISDGVCVIRDGDHIGTRSAADLTQDDIITMMVGRELTELFPREEHDIGEVLLEVNNANAWHASNQHIKLVDDVSFEIRKGEILGVSGLVGAGRTELMQCIFGCYPARYQIDICMNGEGVDISTPREAMDQGITMVPEDRKRHGIVPIMSVGSNITLASLSSFGNCMGQLNEAQEHAEIDRAIARLTVKTATPEQEIRSLSGGNQQKAILAKCLMLNPKVLILDEPTRGIDVGAKYEIYKLMFTLVKQGMAIIMVSSELPEVLGISDRVLVMHEGKLKGNLVNNELTQEQVMDCALTETGGN